MNLADKDLFMSAVEGAFKAHIAEVSTELFTAFASSYNTDEMDAAVIRAQTGISLALGTMHKMKESAR